MKSGKMKKIFSAVLLIVVACLAMTMLACKKKNSGGGGEEEIDPTAVLTLSDYNLRLEVGQTHKLDAQMIKADGTAANAKITFTSEGPLVVAVAEDGMLTALQVGEVSVNVTAGNQRRTCFVTVEGASTTASTTAEIFASASVYLGTSSTVSAGLVSRGKLVAHADSVQWTTGPSDICSVEGNVLTPLAEGTFTLKAQFTIDGVSYEAEKSIRVERLVYYALSQTNIKLATDKTLSGGDNVNNQTTARILSVEERDAVNPSNNRLLTMDQFEITASNPSIVSISRSGDYPLLTAGSAGKTTVVVKVGDKSTIAEVEVATAISSIEDMDVLSMASANDETLLSGSYMLTQDIDYQGGVILPIAAYNSSYITGYVWKYILTKANTASGYTTLARADFFKASTALSDADMVAAVKAGFPNSTKNFSGTFDGNGFAIKNAKILPAYTNASKNIVYSAVFGRISSATVKNVAFSGLSQMDPVTEYFELDLAQAYTSTANPELEEMNKSNGETVAAAAAALISRTFTICTLENVLVDIAFNLDSVSVSSSGLVAWDASSEIKNCFVRVTETTTKHFNRCGLSSTSTNGGPGYFNNIAVGCDKHSNLYGNDVCGVNGNIWTSGTLEDLFDVEINKVATNAKTLEQIVATYSEKVWDFSLFTAASPAMPTLRNNCSVQG